MEIQQQNPQSSSDFERLLLGSPNSSYLWIRYASFYVQLSDISRAREILRRSLEIIHFREEKERFNIWISLMNLECAFGDSQKLEQIFQEASRANDSKTIHLRLASIHQQAGNFEVQIHHINLIPANEHPGRCRLLSKNRK
jgi:rRNA biogenesis protein RRP5